MNNLNRFTAVLNGKDTQFEEAFAREMLECIAHWEGGQSDFLDHPDHLIICKDTTNVFRGHGAMILGGGQYHSTQGVEALKSTSNQLLGNKSSNKMMKKAHMMALGLRDNHAFLFNSLRDEEIFIILFPSCEMLSNDRAMVRHMINTFSSEIVGTPATLNRRTLVRLSNGIESVVNRG